MRSKLFLRGNFTFLKRLKVNEPHIQNKKLQKGRKATSWKPKRI